MDAHHGRIAIEGPPAGQGTRVVIELTTVPAPQSEAPALHGSKDRRSSKKRVLVVEDDRDNADAISHLLRLHGYEVEVANTISAALKKAKNGFDVLVSDIGLPDGTGRDLVRKLGPIRGIALTGYGTDRDVRENTDAGFVRHLTKPVDPDALLEAVGELADTLVTTGGK
jgi:CheY-like chemotaxis protein